MNYSAEHKRQEQNDRRKSIIITFLISLLVFLLLFFYQFTRIIPANEVVTTMLINFGDRKEGNNQEVEPKNEDGSLSAKANEIQSPEPVVEPTPIKKEEPQPKKEEKKPVEKVAEKPKPKEKTAVKDKIITSKNPEKTIPKKETESKTKSETKVKDKTSNSKSEKKSTSASSSAKTSTANASTGSGDGQGAAAVGNLLRGRGNKSSTQGNNTEKSNSGDPLGGDSNGSSRIGEGRNLIAYIPGTMGRGGSQPAHSCAASGTITIAYTVDKAGNVISASRAGGVSDACVVSTSVSWVKRYVKAEKGTGTSTGTYRITF